MLRDVKFDTDPVLDTIDMVCYGLVEPEWLQEGVYLGHLNLSNRVDKSFLKNEYLESWHDEDWSWSLGSYGVCDTPAQMLKKYKEVLADPDRNFAVFFTIIKQCEQSDWGGWRWHKWGEYIGDFTPKCEYLYDEVGIDKVYVYSIVELVNPTPRQLWDANAAKAAADTGAINSFDD